MRGDKGLRSPDVLPHARMHFLGQVLFDYVDIEEVYVGRGIKNSQKLNAI